MSVYEIEPAELDKGTKGLLKHEAVAVDVADTETLLQWLEIVGNEATSDTEADINPDAKLLDWDTELDEQVLLLLSIVLKTEDFNAVVLAEATSLV